MDVTLLVKIAEDAAPAIIALVQQHGGTATIQDQLDRNAETIESDTQTLADEAARDA